MYFDGEVGDGDDGFEIASRELLGGDLASDPRSIGIVLVVA
jgi:hypothetical protein